MTSFDPFIPLQPTEQPTDTYDPRVGRASSHYYPAPSIAKELGSLLSTTMKYFEAQLPEKKREQAAEAQAWAAKASANEQAALLQKAIKSGEVPAGYSIYRLRLANELFARKFYGEVEREADRQVEQFGNPEYKEDPNQVLSQALARVRGRIGLDENYNSPEFGNTFSPLWDQYSSKFLRVTEAKRSKALIKETGDNIQDEATSLILKAVTDEDAGGFNTSVNNLMIAGSRAGVTELRDKIWARVSQQYKSYMDLQTEEGADKADILLDIAEQLNPKGKLNRRTDTEGNYIGPDWEQPGSFAYDKRNEIEGMRSHLAAQREALSKRQDGQVATTNTKNGAYIANILSVSNTWTAWLDKHGATATKAEAVAQIEKILKNENEELNEKDLKRMAGIELTDEVKGLATFALAEQFGVHQGRERQTDSFEKTRQTEALNTSWLPFEAELEGATNIAAGKAIFARYKKDAPHSGSLRHAQAEKNAENLFEAWKKKMREGVQSHAVRDTWQFQQRNQRALVERDVVDVLGPEYAKGYDREGNFDLEEAKKIPPAIRRATEDFFTRIDDPTGDLNLQTRIKDGLKGVSEDDRPEKVEEIIKAYDGELREARKELKQKVEQLAEKRKTIIANASSAFTSPGRVGSNKFDGRHVYDNLLGEDELDDNLFSDMGYAPRQVEQLWDKFVGLLGAGKNFSAITDSHMRYFEEVGPLRTLFEFKMKKFGERTHTTAVKGATEGMQYYKTEDNRLADINNAGRASSIHKTYSQLMAMDAWYRHGRHFKKTGDNRWTDRNGFDIDPAYLNSDIFAVLPRLYVDSSWHKTDQGTAFLRRENKFETDLDALDADIEAARQANIDSPSEATRKTLQEAYSSRAARLEEWKATSPVGKVYASLPKKFQKNPKLLFTRQRDLYGTYWNATTRLFSHVSGSKQGMVTDDLFEPPSGPSKFMEKITGREGDTVSVIDPKTGKPVEQPIRTMMGKAPAYDID